MDLLYPVDGAYFGTTIHMAYSHLAMADDELIVWETEHWQFAI